MAISPRVPTSKQRVEEFQGVAAQRMRIDETNMKLDEFLPQYDFTEIHKVKVKASPQAAFSAMKELLPSELSPLVFFMLNLREVPAILTGKARRIQAEQKPFLNHLYESGFIPLEETDDEIVFGLVGQFWKLTGGEEPSGVTNSRQFQAFDRTDFAKVAANLYVQPSGEETLLSTETRVWAPDPQTRRKFAFYWRVISMGSGWIRVLWLRAIKRRAERSAEE